MGATSFSINTPLAFSTSPKPPALVGIMPSNCGGKEKTLTFLSVLHLRSRTQLFTNRRHIRSLNGQRIATGLKGSSPEHARRVQVGTTPRFRSTANRVKSIPVSMGSHNDTLPVTCLFFIGGKKSSMVPTYWRTCIHSLFIHRSIANTNLSSAILVKRFT